MTRRFAAALMSDASSRRCSRGGVGVSVRGGAGGMRVAFLAGGGVVLAGDDGTVSGGGLRRWGSLLRTGAR